MKEIKEEGYMRHFLNECLNKNVGSNGKISSRASKYGANLTRGQLSDCKKYDQTISWYWNQMYLKCTCFFQLR